MGETVEQRPGQALGAEGPGPFVEGEVGGDERGAPLVALRDQLEQKLGAGRSPVDEAGGRELPSLACLYRTRFSAVRVKSPTSRSVPNS